MATRVVMPALEMAQETGKLLAWRKREGQPVAKGEPLMDIETDKAVVEIEALGDGILSAVRASEGDVIRVGETIAWLLGPGEQIAPTDDQPAATARARTSESQAPLASAGEPAQSPSAHALASPKARRLAAERGIDLRSVSGSGPGGAVLGTDLLATPSSPHTEALTSIWRLMAQRVTASWRDIPQFIVVRDVDGLQLIEARSRLSAVGQVTYTDILVSLVARALHRHRHFNASWTDGAIRRHDGINIGIATAIDDGVVVPVIVNADRTPIGAIAERRREVVERARTGRLQPDDLAGCTFTISNLGMYKVDAFTAIINPPQAAILAVGRLADRVVARDGQVVVRPQMTLTLTSDHRVVDGARAAAFLDDLAETIEHAEAEFP